MKSALTMLAVAALPLLAEEPAKPKTQTAKPVALSPAPVTAADSPLVAAAKRSGRLGKKPTNVITNATLAKSGAHARITTSSEQPPSKMPPVLPPLAPTPEMKASAEREKARKTAEIEAAKTQKLEEVRQRRVAAAAERAEEGMYEELEDPDYGDGERDLEAANAKKPPQR